jgi:transposase-like protein
MLECPRCHKNLLAKLGRTKNGLPVFRCSLCGKRFAVVKIECPHKTECKDYVKGNFCCEECPEFCQKSGL